MDKERTFHMNLVEDLTETLEQRLPEIAAEAGDVEYVQGSMDFWRDIVDSDPSGHTVDGFLKGIANRYGLTVDGADVDPVPDTKYMLGVYTAWAWSMGYVEGVAHGAEAIAGMFDEFPELRVEFEHG